MSALNNILVLMMVWSVIKKDNAVDIIKKVDSVMNAPRTKKAVFTMTLQGKDGNKTIRSGITYETSDEKRLIKFTEPASVKGIAFLSLPGDLMYVYLPSFRKVRRIATSVKNTNFAGTDFTYDELSTFKYSKKYKPILLSESDTLWVLKLIPIKKGDYDHLIMHVDKRYYVPVRIEFYDRAGNLWKILLQTRIKKIKNYHLSTLLSMEDVKKKHKTVMDIKSMKLDIEIPPKVFTKRYLRR